MVEGLLTAIAVRVAGGGMVARLAPQSEEELEAVVAAGLDPRAILSGDEWVQSQQVFFAATGITDGALLNGVQYDGAMARSNSLILRGETRTRRTVFAEHLLEGREAKSANNANPRQGTGNAVGARHPERGVPLRVLSGRGEWT